MKHFRGKNCIWILIALALLLAGCSTRSGTDAAAATPDPKPAAPAQTASPVIAATAAPSPEPGTAAPTPARPEPAQETPPARPASLPPNLSEQPPVDDSFFEDAAFFGNSLVDGLRLYGGLEHGDYYAVTSASVVSVGMTKNSAMNDGTAATLLDALLEDSYGKIYILLGINEIGFDTAYFTELYDDMLGTIEAAESGAEIYIMSLTPVTKAKSDAGTTFSIDRVNEYNEALHRLATQHGCWYVDLMDALADDTGYLPADCSTDGVHLTASTYGVWADYLRTHYNPS